MVCEEPGCQVQNYRKWISVRRQNGNQGEARCRQPRTRGCASAINTKRREAHKERHETGHELRPGKRRNQSYGDDPERETSRLFIALESLPGRCQSDTQQCRLRDHGEDIGNRPRIAAGAVEKKLDGPSKVEVVRMPGELNRLSERS